MSGDLIDGYEYAGELFLRPKVYIAGPMTGIPQFNFPAFDRAAAHLRSVGYDVVSPAEMDALEGFRETAMASPDGRLADQFNGETWGDFLARDVKLIADGGIEGVFVLAGWERSRGARLETFVAHLCGLWIQDVYGGDPIRMSTLLAAWEGLL